MDADVQRTQDHIKDEAFVRRAVEASIRIGLVFLLVAWCFEIVRPFAVPVAWGIIIAVAAYPCYRRLETVLGGRTALAAVLFTIAMLVVLIVPTVMLAGTLVEGAKRIAAEIGDGTLVIPPPVEGVAQWPFIGESLDSFWRLASDDLEAALNQIRPQIAAGGRLLLTAATNAGIGILQFILAIVIAGGLLAYAHAGDRAAHAVATRLAGARGAEYADLGQATVRSVARGILGVALIQSLLAGLGFLAAGVPAAGLLALICLMLSVVQLGPGLVIIPSVIWVFSTADTLTAILFLTWSLFVQFLDNVLKPILLGRGVKVPMLVIFAGAIGGFLTSGIIGLFVGSVVLALGYTLLLAWLKQAPSTPGGS